MFVCVWMKHEGVLSKLLTCDLWLMLRYDDDTRTPMIENNALPVPCPQNLWLKCTANLLKLHTLRIISTKCSQYAK
jgi:hypothetical protein